MKQLKLLDLTDNNIQYIATRVTKEIEDIELRNNLTIYISGNQLLCDYDHSEFVLWLRYTHTIYKLGNVSCNFENGSYVSLKQVTELYDYLTVHCDKLSCDCDRNLLTLGFTGSILRFKSAALLVSIRMVHR